MIDIFLVNQDCTAAKTLSAKMANSKPGSIIFVTDEEMDSFTAGGVERITSHDEKAGDIQLVEVDPEKYYIAIVKEGFVNIDDIKFTIDTLGLTMKVIRTK